MNQFTTLQLPDGTEQTLETLHLQGVPTFEVVSYLRERGYDSLTYQGLKAMAEYLPAAATLYSWVDRLYLHDPMKELKPLLDKGFFTAMVSTETSNREKLALIWRRLGGSIRISDFADVETLLKGLDVTSLTTSVLVGLLGVTLPVKVLHCRQDFLARVREVLSEREPLRMEALLQGLE